MGEDAIERWHQIRMRHHARIRSLRSDQRQKNSQAKFEHATNNANLKKIITDVNAKTKRNMKKDQSLSSQREERRKSFREQRRNKVKEEVQEEPRIQMKTPREQAKEDYIASHSV